MTFDKDYPSTAPIVKFVPILWHMNVWADGRICLNLLNAADGTWHGQWSPSITIKQILLAIQELLDNPSACRAALPRRASSGALPRRASLF